MVFIPLSYIPLPILFVALAVFCFQFLCVEGRFVRKDMPDGFAVVSAAVALAQ